MSEGREDFDTELRRMFAMADDPTDDAFVARVSAGVARTEGRARMGRAARAAAMGVGGAAAAVGLYFAAVAVAPQLQTGLLSDALLLLTAQAPGGLQGAAFGVPLMMMLGAAVGGGASLLMQRRDD